MDNSIWNEEKCIRLIREYKARPALWDSKHLLYYKKPVKLELWKEIGNALNTQAAACRRKMLVLMSSLRREKARIRNSRQGRAGEKPYKSKWFAFEELKFLVSKEKIKRYGQIEEECQQDGHESNDEETSSNTRYENTNAVNMIPNTLHSVTPHQISHIDMNDLINISRPATSRVDSQSDAEIRAFADFIAAKMMKYSESTKNSVERSICDIIFKADAKSYEEPDTSETKKEGMDMLNESNVHDLKIEIEEDESD